MQFYGVILKGELAAQDVINTFWWRRDIGDVPDDGDLEDIADHVQNTVLPKIAAMTHNSMLWKEITVQGYHTNWNRAPYLPYIRAINTAGALTGTSCIPLIALTLSFRVQPVQNAPTGKPVRRGYIHLAGMSEAFCLPTGLWDTALLTHVGLTAIRNELISKPIIAGDVTAIEPIRVSAGDPVSGARGYGLALQCNARAEVTTRRSRMVGKGG